MKVLKQFQLKPEETAIIQYYFQRLDTLRKLVAAEANSSDEQFDPLMDRLTKAQYQYDLWFKEKEKELRDAGSLFGVLEDGMEKNSWTVNFENNTLTLMEK